jgi:shikimate dehydrogenase
MGDFTMLIAGTTKLLGVMGYPIEHSLSPAMHNAALAEVGLDYVYVPLLVQPERLGEAMAGLQALGWAGCSVTIPHKQSIMVYLEEITPGARAIGAVNTIWPTATGWQGTNTDIVGFLAPLQALAQDWSQVSLVVLGCGGAARAVVAAGQELGCGSIAVVARDRVKLEEFQASWRQPPQIQLWSQVDELLPAAGLVVNCTPIGMAPQTQASPLTAAQVALLGKGAIVYDLIYSPRPTELLKLAGARGCLAIDGVDMLVYQGAAAWQYWLDRTAPVEVMKQALLGRLNNR